MRRHRHSSHPPSGLPGATHPLASSTAQAAPLPHDAKRRVAWGQAVIATWYLGGFVLLFAGALLQVGPSAWVAAWEVRHWGYDNAVVSFLPGFLVLVASAFLPRLLPRAPEGSFLRGMQNGLSPDGPVQAPSPERMARILLLLARGALVASGVFLLAGGLGYELVTRIGDRGAGAPLPELTLSAVTAASASLPPYARLMGTTPRPELTWLHDHSERRITHSDAFTPLTASGWRPGDPVAVLEEDAMVLGEDGPDAVLPPGPVEGALERGTVPDWMLGEMRRHGIAITDDLVVLVRRKLDGVVPGADTIGAVLCLLFGGAFALVALAVSFGYRYRRVCILRALAAAPAGSARTAGRA